MHVQQHQIDDVPTELSSSCCNILLVTVFSNVQKTVSSIQAKLDNAFLAYSSLLACSIGIKHGRVSKFEFESQGSR